MAALPLLQRIFIGVISGIVATGPMTAAMILLHRRLSREERYPLPPREITMKLARDTGIDDKMDREARSVATLLGHFGYGAACGALYGGAVEPREQPFAKGIIFSLLVWVVSYAGWLPAAGILRPVDEQPARRSALMIAAHLLWGATLGGFAALLADESESSRPQPFSSATLPNGDVSTRN